MATILLSAPLGSSSCVDGFVTNFNETQTIGHLKIIKWILNSLFLFILGPIKHHKLSKHNKMHFPLDVYQYVCVSVFFFLSA